MSNYFYIVTDVETNGPSLTQHSLLGFASIACDAAGNQVGEFEVNLYPYTNRKQHNETMTWWGSQTEAWNYLQNNRYDPLEGFKKYESWLKTFQGSLIFVAHPLWWDRQWISAYFQDLYEKDPFFDHGIDLATYASAILKKPITESVRSFWPKDWLGNVEHNHRAIDDARGYANALKAMLQIERTMLQDSR
jgi:DNA polymerase III alpha subunit (gram-positive type)